MSWREHLTDMERGLVADYEHRRDVGRSEIRALSEEVARIRNTCVQRARRSLIPEEEGE